MKITFIHHSSFLVESASAYLLFDYTEGEIPVMEAEKPLFVFASHRHGDHYSAGIFELGKKYERTRFILSDDIWRRRLPAEVLPVTDSIKAGEHREYEWDGGTMGVTAFRSTDEGVAFLVELDGKRIYHAGDLNNWTWAGEPEMDNHNMAAKYSSQIDKMAGSYLDAAFLPLDPRQEEAFYLGLDEFSKKVEVGHIFPMHCWGDFSVIGKLKGMECSAAYRDRVEDICLDGQMFEIEK